MTMNRRRLFTALAVALAIVIFFAAKTTASWRPIKIGMLSVTGPMEAITLMRASQREITFGAAPSYNGSDTFDDALKRESLLGLDLIASQHEARLAIKSTLKLLSRSAHTPKVSEPLSKESW